MGVLVFSHVLFVMASVPLAVIDLKTHRLPDVITLPLWALSALWVAISAPTIGVVSAEKAIVGSALAVLVLWLLAESPGAPLGFGDVKLGGVIGVQLGSYGVEAVLLALIVAFIVGGLVAVWLIARGRIRGRDHLAFGPFLLIGAMLVLMLAG